VIEDKLFPLSIESVTTRLCVEIANHYISKPLLENCQNILFKYSALPYHVTITIRHAES